MKDNRTQALTVPDPNNLRTLLASEFLQKQMAMALPKHLTAERMMRTALTALMRNPKLLACDQQSLVLAMLNLSQWGLEPDGRRAHLIPYWNSKRNCYEMQAQPDYKGIVELVIDGGTVTGIHADVVCDNDEFSYNKGSIETHKIDLKRPRGEPYAAYTIIEMREGKPKCEVMTREEIEAIRNRSPGWQAFVSKRVSSNVWNDYPGEMWKKTVFKRASKWIKLGSRAQSAIEIDDAQEIGITLPAQPVSLPDAGPESPGQLDQPQPGRIEEPGESEEEAQRDMGLAPAQTKVKKPTTPAASPQEELAAAHFVGFPAHADVLAPAEEIAAGRGA